jgi:hypothetical protein
MPPSQGYKTSHLMTGRFAAAFLAAAILAGVATALAQAPAQPPYKPLPPPDFSGLWQHTPIAVFEGMPFKADPVHDLKGALDPTYFGVTFEGDDSAPILEPAAAREVKRHTEAARAGNPVPTPQEVCQPSGVPNVLTLPAPVQIFQLSDKVVFLFQRDHQVRHVYLTANHSKPVRTSWYGESIGHYEGDTLVVDTIGTNDKTPVDIFGTPHSAAMHVVERYRLLPNGRQMEVVFTVDDPATFTSEWSGRIVYGRSNAPLIEEEACAENDRLPEGVYDIPVEKTPPF